VGEKSPIDMRQHRRLPESRPQERSVDSVGAELKRKGQ
jgi:hypothetical protein